MKKNDLSLSVYPWLRSNLGKHVLGALTSCDVYALDASVHLAMLWGYTRSEKVAEAFGAAVRTMQPRTRYLAFHAIAHALDWSDRDVLWMVAGLDLSDRPKFECSFGPGGACVDLAKAGAR